MKEVEIFENEKARDYQQFVDTWILNYDYFLDCLPKLFSQISDKKLLVVGCGTGNEIERFAKSSAQWQITGIDPSPEMISQAREKLQTYDNITLVEGLLSNLDCQEKYNAATLLLVLHFFAEETKLNLLKDVADRLVSGADFVLLDITGDKEQIKQNLEVLRLLVPSHIDEEQIKIRFNRIANELRAISEQRLCELCVEAGFEPPLRFFQSSIYMGWLMKKK